jgi:hypothetical protein
MGSETVLSSETRSPLTKAGGRRQKAVGTQFVTGIYAPLQKLFALIRRGFRPDCCDNNLVMGESELRQCLGFIRFLPNYLKNYGLRNP